MVGFILRHKLPAIIFKQKSGGEKGQKVGGEVDDS